VPTNGEPSRFAGYSQYSVSFLVSIGSLYVMQPGDRFDIKCGDIKCSHSGENRQESERTSESLPVRDLLISILYSESAAKAHHRVCLGCAKLSIFK